MSITTQPEEWHFVVYDDDDGDRVGVDGLDDGRDDDDCDDDDEEEDKGVKSIESAPKGGA